MDMLLVDVAGWIGAALILIAYYLITKRIVDAKSRLYHSLNLIGGAGLAYNTYVYTAYPSTIVNIFWIAIAVYGLWESLRK